MVGYPYECKVIDGGKSVRLYPLNRRAGPRIVSEAGSYAYVIPEEYGKGFVNVYVHLQPAGNAEWTVRTDEPRAGSVEGAAVVFLDVDLDGRASGFGRDGYVVGGGPYVLPLRREVVLGSKVVEIRRIGPDGTAVAFRSRPLAAKGADLEGCLRLNAWRTASGVPALAWDADASVGALLHAEYLAENFPQGVPPDFPD